MKATAFFTGRSFTSADRQPIAVIPLDDIADAAPRCSIRSEAGGQCMLPVGHEPVNEYWVSPDTFHQFERVPVRRPDAIDEAFAKARETISELIDAAGCWSVAQAADYRRAK